MNAIHTAMAKIIQITAFFICDASPSVGYVLLFGGVKLVKPRHCVQQIYFKGEREGGKGQREHSSEAIPCKLYCTRSSFRMIISRRNSIIYVSHHLLRHKVRHEITYVMSGLLPHTY